VYRAGDGVHRRWLELRRAAAGPMERLAIALNPYHRYVCAAEKEMFEHPRLRAVICNSRMVREEVQRSFRIAPEKLHVIYNGVDLEHFHPRHREALRGKARADLGCQPRDTLALFVGAGYARKGLGAAIDALALAKNESFWLLVAGRDRDEQHYVDRAARAGVGKRVRFLGAKEDVRPLYAAADCFILPSRYDPFPNTALEALAMGLPALVSRRCGAAEVVVHGESGWLCDPDDAVGIAALMQEADQAVRRGSMQHAARAVAERFGIDVMAAKLAELYRTLPK
jgi:UDP-glucose:(heptosyl)LPS alpha-1,3-glucosyltransferase